MRKMISFAIACILSCFVFSCARQSPAVLRIATTTSVENTGLADILVPEFEKEAGAKVNLVAVGTGQALRIAREGNADLVFVHDREAEEKFINEGYGTKRSEVMRNYFALVGPPGLEKELDGKDVLSILRWVNDNKRIFVSRGDESGTHVREKKLWELAGTGGSRGQYLEAGSSMIATLRLASEKGGFTLSDTATFLSHQKELNLRSYSGEDPSLVNIYSVIPVNPAKAPSANVSLAEKFVKFVTVGKGREIILGYGREKYGSPLFLPLQD